MRQQIIPFLGHKGTVHNLKAKEFNTFDQLRGVKNDLCIGRRSDQTLFL